MIKSSPWPKLLPPLGVVLAGVLLAAAGVVWWNGSAPPASDGGLGELVATAQAARAEARAALAGAAEEQCRESHETSDVIAHA